MEMPEVLLQELEVGCLYFGKGCRLLHFLPVMHRFNCQGHRPHQSVDGVKVNAPIRRIPNSLEALYDLKPFRNPYLSGLKLLLEYLQPAL